MPGIPGRFKVRYTIYIHNIFKLSHHSAGGLDVHRIDPATSIQQDRVYGRDGIQSMDLAYFQSTQLLDVGKSIPAIE